MATRVNIDDGGISRALDFCRTLRTRQILRCYYGGDHSVEETSLLLELPRSVVISEIVLINQIIKDNLILRTCTQCGKEYYTNSPRKRICKKCEKVNRAENIRKTNELYKVYTPRKKAKFKSIYQVIRDVEKYNKEHGTNLSYGKYVLLMGGE